MIVLYCKKHLLSPISWVSFLVIFLFSVCILPSQVSHLYDSASLNTICFTQSEFLSPIGAVCLYLPLFSIYLLFHQQMFLKSQVICRCSAPGHYWRLQVWALALDVLLFVVILSVCELCYFAALGQMGLYWGSLPVIGRMVIQRFFSLFLYGLAYVLVSNLKFSALSGISLSYLAALLEFAIFFLFRKEVFFLLRGLCFPPEQLASWAYCLLITGLPAAALCLFAGALFQRRDYLKKELA